MTASYDQDVQEWIRKQIYQGYPLDPTQKQIRLFELYPGSPSEKLTGRLFVTSLDDPPPYAAVSYVWGDRVAAYSIALSDGAPLRIGRNLHHALRDLRHPSQKVVLWTDAICIQQHIGAEQSHQVQMMAQIYSRARSVRAWIDHEINLGAQIFQELPDVLNAPDLRADVRYWQPALSLLQNEYWKRLWVQQELILSREIVINCRDITLDARFTAWLLQLPSNVSTRARIHEDRRLYDVDEGINGGVWEPIFKGISSARYFQARRSDYHHSLSSPASPGFLSVMGWASLLVLFLDTCRLETAEPKDRVYGMLGLAMDLDDGDVEVDYSLSLAGVYAKIPEMMLRKHGFLMFLCHETQVHGRLGMPSWLPAPERKSMMIWSAIGMNPNFAKIKAVGASISPNGRCLSARGSFISRVTRVYAKQDFRLVPILQIAGFFKDYLDRKRGLFRLGNIWDDDEILYICTPWFQDGLFRSLKIPKLDRKQQQATLKKLLLIAERLGRTNLRPVDTLTYDLSKQATPQEIQAFRAMLFAFQEQALFETADFRLGTVFWHSPVQTGDEVWCLFGCPLPLILRPCPDKRYDFTWVGFVRNMAGLMMGEGLAGLPESAPLGYTRQGRDIRQVSIW